VGFFSLIHGLPGLRRATFKNAEGGLVEGMGEITAESENLSLVAETIAFHLAQAGRLLRRGECELIVVRAQGAATALVLRLGALAILEFDGKQLSPDVEMKLRTTDWTAADAVITNPMGTASSSEISAALTGCLSSSTLASLASDDAAPSYDVPLNPMMASPSAEIAAMVVDVPSAPTPSAGHRMRRMKITASVAAVGGDETMFAGSLRMVGLPDLLEFCRHGQRTGILFCHLGNSTGSVKVSRGKILEAESPKTATATLLTRLIESGNASEEQVKELDLGSDDSADDETVGRLLVDAGFTDEEAIRNARLDQIKESIEEMIAWVDGTFAFHPMEEDPIADQIWNIDPDAILLQIFKEQDEKAHHKQSG